MNDKEAITLFESLHPGHFSDPGILALPADEVFDELILPLAEFDRSRFPKAPDDISFAVRRGCCDELREAVAKVDPGWVRFFGENDRVCCGYSGSAIASFCIIDDMGTHIVNGRKLKVGGPGCVGTLPGSRGRGTGLAMVADVTEILKSEGFDLGYIHYTHIAPWYEKLGYRIAVKWGRNGIISPAEC